MNILIVIYFLVSPVISQICLENSECNINSYCDYSTGKLSHRIRFMQM